MRITHRQPAQRPALSFLVMALVLALAASMPARGGPARGGPARGAPAPRDPGALAAELSRLRSETEQLAADLDGEKESLRSSLRALAAQKADLELEVRREQVRLEQLRERAEERKERAAADAKAREALVPAVKDAVERLRTVVRAGLPFHAEERAEQLTTIAGQLDEGLLSPYDAVARLWDRVEDELRLSRESGLYQQVVPLADGDALVDVARLGMVALLYRTKDGRLGRAERTDGGWRFRPFAREEDRVRAAALFDAFEKQVRTGFFVLPGDVLAVEGS